MSCRGQLKTDIQKLKDVTTKKALLVNIYDEKDNERQKEVIDKDSLVPREEHGGDGCVQRAGRGGGTEKEK